MNECTCMASVESLNEKHTPLQRNFFYSKLEKRCYNLIITTRKVNTQQTCSAQLACAMILQPAHLLRTPSFCMKIRQQRRLWVLSQTSNEPALCSRYSVILPWSHLSGGQKIFFPYQILYCHEISTTICTILTENCSPEKAVQVSTWSKFSRL